jgi:hypothetical protein
MTTQEQDLDALLAKDVEALRAREAVRRQAATDPLPGPAAAAWAGEPTRVHGFELRPVVGGDVILLKRLDSPLIRRTKELVEHFRKVSMGVIEEGTPCPESTYEDEEGVEMVYQFLVPIATARGALSLGRERFREIALQFVADRVPYPILAELIAAVEMNYQKSFSTFLRYEARKEGDSQPRNFSMPPAETQTGSAGGSTTTAG